MTLFARGRAVAIVGLLVGGTALGVLLAGFVGRQILLEEGKNAVHSYADRLIAMADQVSAESRETFIAVLHDGLPFCSDQEIAFLRDYVYRSAHIRDIGRTRDARLFCTTGVGRLVSPVPTSVPDMQLGELRLYVNRRLLISPTTLGFVAERNGVSLVLAPAVIQVPQEPPKFYAAYLFDRRKHRLLPWYGPDIPLHEEQVEAGKPVELNGVYYEPVCSANSPVCMVAAETVKNILARKSRLYAGFLSGGGLLGFVCTALIVLFYKRQRSLERQLRRAIRCGKIDLVYQPVIDLESEAIVGAEVLARWTNEAREAVKADVFVAIAEEKGFVTLLTRLVLTKALHEMWDLLRDANFRLTINITAEDLADPEFFAFLDESVQAVGILPSCVGLELTERSTANQDIAIQAIRALRKAGHSVYIDDFGTGYSSLSYLHTLAVDAIKMDRGFTQTVGTGAITATVVPQILTMAAEMNLLVVVEGIETAEQAEYFRRTGRRLQGQGWLFGKPLPSAQFRRMLREHAPAPAVVGENAL